MHRPLLLRGARQLLTLRGTPGPRRGTGCLDLGIITDGSILIRDGRIVCVGQSRRIDNLAEARNAIVHEVNGAVVMPGFVDASACIPDNALQSRRLFELALAHGTTAMAGRASYSVLRGLAADLPPFLALDTVINVANGFDPAQITRAVRRKLASALRVELQAHSRADLHYFHSLEVPIRAHAANTHNPDWVALAVAYGAAVAEVEAPLNRAQLALFADSPIAAVLTPAAAPAARALIDADATVALGSGFGSPGTATCSMQAASLFAARDGGLDLAEAITLSTINAAYALGVSGDCGSLEAGKRADLLVLHLSNYKDLPQFSGVNVVSKIFRAGNLVA